MNRRNIRNLLGALALAVTPPAFAGSSFSANAQVVHVEPLTEQVYVTVGRRKCAAPAPARLLDPASTLGADIRAQERLARRPARCHWVEVLEPEEHVTGYRVTYSYGGQEYTRVMQEPPGAFLPVRVTLQPVNY